MPLQRLSLPESTQGRLLLATAIAGTAFGVYFLVSSYSSASNPPKKDDELASKPIYAQEVEKDAKGDQRSSCSAPWKNIPEPEGSLERPAPQPFSEGPSTSQPNTTATTPKGGLDLRSGDDTKENLEPSNSRQHTQGGEAGKDESPTGPELPYGWAQSETEILMVFPVAPDVTSKQCKISILSKKLKVVVKGDTLADGPLERSIIPDDSTWQLETLPSGEKRLTLTLCKVDDPNGYNFWPCVIQGHPHVSPYAAPIALNKDPLRDD